MVPPTKAMLKNRCDLCLTQHSKTNDLCRDTDDSAAYGPDNMIYEMNGSRLRNSRLCEINVIGSNIGVKRSIVELITR